jgi:riboflavin biosynthesis pyrimidine reductase
MSARIDRLWPDPQHGLTDDDVIDALAVTEPTVRANFVSSIDGATALNGRSGGLSGDADKRHFELLRRVADVVLVGAGTVRDEGYGALRVSESSALWRTEHGMPPHPVFAIASRRLDLDPTSPIFTEAPVRPIIVTEESADAAPFASLAHVIAVTDDAAGLSAALAAVRALGLQQVLCEGGPSLFAALLAADLIDELCLTVAPTLVGGDGPRLVGGDIPPTAMRLAHVLRGGDELLVRYLRRVE